MLAYRRLCARFLLEILSCGKVVGVWMSVENPFDRQATIADVIENCVCIDRRRGPDFSSKSRTDLQWRKYRLPDRTPRTEHWRFAYRKSLLPAVDGQQSV